MNLRTIAELARELEDRSLNLTVHVPEACTPPEWVVHIVACDDPGCVAIGTGTDLESAIRCALAEWDKLPPALDLPSLEPKAESRPS